MVKSIFLRLITAYRTFKTNHPWKNRILIGLLACLLLLIVGLIVIIGYAASKVPSRESLLSIQNPTASEVYSVDGVLLGKYFIFERSNVSFDEISPYVTDALIATEDVRFYEHTGVDAGSLPRVLVKSLILRQESAGGGSTISQQLIKNLFPRPRYRFFSLMVNKIKEAITARELEKILSKKEILALYLNTVSFGDNAYGIKVAAKRFFNTTPAQLTVDQAAVLVGMLKAPTYYNPRKNPETSKIRRNVVLEQMVKYKYLSAATADSAQALPLKIQYTVEDHNEGLATYFREQLRQELLTWCEENPKEDGSSYNLYTDGLKIYTTIDSRMQRYAEQAVTEHMTVLQRLFMQHWKGRTPWGKDKGVVEDAKRRSEHYRNLKEQGLTEKEIDKIFSVPVEMNVFTWAGDKEVTMSPMDSIRYYQYFLQVGLLAMSPQDGEVKAWVGGINHEHFQYDHVNIHTKRQVGSTFKPIVYASALEQGIEPCERFENVQKVYEQFDGWSPGNSEDEYGGTYSMEGALTKSVNTISAELIVRSGIGNTIKLARKLGVQSELEPIPSMALGSADVSLIEMVTAYGAFANQGLVNQPVYLLKIEDKNGKVIFKHQKVKAKRALSEENAALLTHMMQNVINEGTGSSLRSQYGFKSDIAGKTGTTQSQADGWFIGYSPRLVAGVWVGAEDRRVHFRSLALGKGAATALPVWAKFMSKVNRDPAFAKSGRASFAPLSEDALAKLNREAYEEPKTKLWDKLFGDKDNEEKQKEKEERKREKEERRKEREENPKKGFWGMFRKKAE